MSTTSPSGPTTTASPRSLQARAFVAEHFGVVSISVVFAILFIVFSVQADAFLTGENMVNVLRQSSPTIIVAVAMTFVITTGAIDLSVGSIVGLTAAALALLADGGNPWVALVLTLALGAFVGFANGAIIAWGRLQSFIVTLAALTAVRGIALLITDGYSTPITASGLLQLGQGKIIGLFVPTWIAVAVVAIGWYVFNHTRFGRYTTAVGSNAESLRRTGVNVDRIRVAVMVGTGLAAAIAGVLTATRLASGSSNSGNLFELEVITAVVLGGTSLMGGRGTILGSVMGALTLGIINNGLVLLGIDVYWVPIVQGTILIVAIYLNSNLFRRIAGSAA